MNNLRMEYFQIYKDNNSVKDTYFRLCYIYQNQENNMIIVLFNVLIYKNNQINYTSDKILISIVYILLILINNRII
jgi:hypothetical protein